MPAVCEAGEAEVKVTNPNTNPFPFNIPFALPYGFENVATKAAEAAEAMPRIAKAYDTELSVALDKAADLLERPNGWIRNRLFGENSSCAMGAIMASTGFDIGPKSLGDRAVSAIVNEIGQNRNIYPALAMPQLDFIGTVCAWNNRATQTQEEVVMTFRDAATKERMRSVLG